MATGGTAPPPALSSSTPSFLDHSPSNLSSPLSDVGDKDAETDYMDVDSQANPSARSKSPRRQRVGGLGGPASGFESDDESRLSDLNLNDSEAETERLFDSPRKSNGTHHVVDVAGEDRREGRREDRTRRMRDRHRRNGEVSPSKLQEQLRIEADAKNNSSDIGSLSDVDADEADDDASVASSAADKAHRHKSRMRSVSPVKGTGHTEPTAVSATSQDTRQASAEFRKRKRSLAATGIFESEQPLKKRVDSNPNGNTARHVTAGRHVPAGHAAGGDDEGISTTPHSGDLTGEEDDEESGPTKTKGKVAESIEQEVPRPKKVTRNGLKRRRNKNMAVDTRHGQGVSQEDSQDERSRAVADAPGPAVDEAVDDVEEEAEAAHKGEEELGRKRAAWEELTAIEKQFSSLRERLHQERLEQLKQEEAMLTKENPDHPEYLAMMRCVDERRDERIRVSTVELQLKSEVLKNRAVAERSQIMSQFQQDVRALREELLEDLGNEWYEVQHERRRHANTIPDFGIRFPGTKQESVRNAVAYNKEVSVLSGFAKHVGFPAAPSMNGASEDQVENDFDAIVRTRDSVMRPFPQQGALRQQFTEGLPFGRTLSAAAEQFMEQTPWANPNHPAHHHPLQQAQPEMGHFSVGDSPTGNRRQSHQPGGTTHLDIGPLVNGESSSARQKSQSSAGRGSVKTSKATHGAEARATRDTMTQPT